MRYASHQGLSWMTNITHIIDRAPRQDIDIWTEEKIHLMDTQTARVWKENKSLCEG